MTGCLPLKAQAYIHRGCLGYDNPLFLMVVSEAAGNTTTPPQINTTPPHGSFPGPSFLLSRSREVGLQATGPILKDATQEFGGGITHTAPNLVPQNLMQQNITNERDAPRNHYRKHVYSQSQTSRPTLPNGPPSNTTNHPNTSHY
ncbi:hypothetical protein BDR06DRAFT_1009006 [Suillus hirtellus]|nr:hypothetical protein BDR06DRAFT_1009006 [Suillus hirtellus]